jgi:membrane-anchored glycerophosphoryl diester phosphodiesterase (GDPDase)
MDKKPFTVWKTIGLAINFVGENLLWILPMGCIALFAQCYAEALPNETESWKVIGHQLLLVMLGTLLSYPLIGAVTLKVERKITWGRAFQEGVRRWIPITLLQIGINISTALAFLALFIPGLIVATATALAIPAMMLEGLGPMKAFDRSWELTKKSRMRIFGLMLLNILLLYGIGGQPTYIIKILPLQPIYRAGLAALITAPLAAVWPAVTTLIYMRLRDREETSSIEVVE